MKRALILMALLAVLAVSAAVVYQAAARERDYRRLLAEGDAALAGGQTFAAIETYSGAIALRPDSMLAHLRRGETYLLRGDLDGAARDFRAAATLDPTATRPLEQWGEVLYRQQRFRRAAEVYENRLKLDDRSGAVHYRLGLARYREGNFDGAIASLRHASRLDPQLAEAHYVVGLSQRELGHLADAQVAFEKAIGLAPGLIAAREELADVYGLNGLGDQEIQQLQVLAGMDSGHLERRIAVGLAHARAGQADLAVLTLANTLQQAPDHLAIYGALGRVWLEIAESQGDRPDALAKALEALERAASAAGATSETKTLYGRALLLGRQMDAAERVLQQATERYPAEPIAFALYATVAEQQRHYEAARASLIAYSALVNEDDEFAERAARIGNLSLRLNDFPAAVAWYERACASAPAALAPLRALADAQWRAGQKEAARETIARGLRLDAHDRLLIALQRRVGLS